MAAKSYGFLAPKTGPWECVFFEVCSAKHVGSVPLGDPRSAPAEIPRPQDCARRAPETPEESFRSQECTRRVPETLGVHQDRPRDPRSAPGECLRSQECAQEYTC